MWRDSGRSIRFFGIDGRAASAFIVVLVHISLVTIAIAVSLIVLFFILEQMGYTVPNARRKAVVVLLGNKRKAVSWIRQAKYR